MIDTILKLIFLTIIPLALVAVIVWYGQLLHASIAGRFPDGIDEFTVVGSQQPSQDEGKKFAAQLSAELARVSRQLDNTFRILRDPPSPKSFARRNDDSGAENKGTYLLGWDPNTLDLPSETYKAIDFTMTFKGVDVKGLLDWARRTIFSWQSMKVVYQRRGAGDSVVAYGNLDTIGKTNFYLEIKNSEKLPQDRMDEKMVETISRAISGYQLFRSEQALEGLSDAQRATLVASLVELAQALEKRPEPSELEGLRKRLKELSDRAPESPNLLSLNASAAWASNKPDEELNWLKKTQTLLAESRPLPPARLEQMKAVNRRIAVLNEQQKALKVAAGRRAGIDPRGLLSPETLFSPGGWSPGRIDASRLELASIVQPILKMIGVDHGEKMPRQVKVGLVGLSKPEPILRSKNLELLEYTEALKSAITNVAPEAEFVFKGGIGDRPVRSSDLALTESVRQLAKDPEVEIILLTLGGVNTEKELDPVLEAELSRAVSSGKIVVRAAGDEGLSSSPLEKVAESPGFLVVGSLKAPEGQRDSLSNSFKGLVWAPGTDIPHIYQGQIDKWSGTSFASAIVAGIAARLLADFKDMNSVFVTEAIKATSQPIKSGEPKAVNYERAKGLLAKHAKALNPSNESESGGKKDQEDSATSPVE